MDPLEVVPHVATTKFVVWYDGANSSIHPAGPKDEGRPFGECKKELLASLQLARYQYADAIRRVRALRASEVADECYDRHVPFHPTHRYLHGGPAVLDGGHLMRHKRARADAGALFFSEDTREGRLYAANYALRAAMPAIWIVQIHLSVNLVFDFARKAHRVRLARTMSPHAWQTISSRAAAMGQLDWPDVDEELLAEAGFLGALVHERAAGFLGERPVISVAVFDPAHVEIVGQFDRSAIDELAHELLVISTRSPRP